MIVAGLCAIPVDTVQNALKIQLIKQGQVVLEMWLRTDTFKAPFSSAQ